MKKISFLLCFGITLNCFAMERAFENKVNSFEKSLVYKDISEEKGSLEKVAKELFADPLCTRLNKRVGKRKIRSCPNEELRNLAMALHSGRYDTKFRVNSFKPIYSPEALGKLLHIGNGELKNGINVIEKTSEWTGLAYMDYYFDNPEKENTIKVHFITGEINGYFDASVNTNEDWDRMLANAVYPVFDATGSNIHLAYPVEDLKKYAPGQGKELIEVYEQLVSKQHEIIGWKKYNHITNNKIFARVNYGYYMFRDGDGVAFKFDTMKRVADPVHMR